MIEVVRPKAPEKKINTHEDFELCLLRHQYFRRAKFNPTEAEMQPYMYIVTNLSRNTFFVYANLFKSVGLHLEDVTNIGRVHLVSFMGLYTMELMKDKKRDYEQKFIIDKKRDPNEEDFLQKNRANFSLFFKQRMEDLVRVCRQKVRNVKGQPSEEYVVFCGKNKPPKLVHKLLKEHQELKFKKMDFSTFKSIRKKADVNNDATMFTFGDIWYVAIALDQRNLDIEDIICSGYNPYENVHNIQPDVIYEEREAQQFNALFNAKSDHKKRMVLRKFVAKNKLNRHYKEEVATARKLLRSLT